jgi:hypothetical protein
MKNVHKRPTNIRIHAVGLGALQDKEVERNEVNHVKRERLTAIFPLIGEVGPGPVEHRLSIVSLMINADDEEVP